MVKPLSSSYKQAIAQAITEAERRTSAEIFVVVAPASDAYLSYILLYGIVLGSMVSMGLWGTGALTVFPSLLTVQLGVIMLMSLMPILRNACLRLVPRRIKNHRAAHRAYEEYLIASKHVPTSTPMLLFYVSLAEHYAHIVPSRAVREKIPNAQWDTLINTFTGSIQAQSIDTACGAAIERITTMLVPYFPA